VPARSGDLEREPGGGLAPHVGEVGAGHRRRQHRRLGRVGPGIPTRERAHHLLEATDRPDHMSPDELGLQRAPGRHHDLGIGECVDQRQRTGYRPHRAVEAQLTHEGASLARARRQLLARHQQAHSDREVKPGADFAHARRRQVDRDPRAGPRQPAGHEGGPDAIARLAAGGVGKANDGEAGQTPGDMDLDPNGPALDAEQGRRCNGSEHEQCLLGHGDQGGPPEFGALDPARPYDDRSVLTPYPKDMTFTAMSAHTTNVIHGALTLRTTQSGSG
jgi:hypothetical protein